MLPTIAGIPSREMTGEYASSVRPAATPSAMKRRRSSEDFPSSRNESAIQTETAPSGYSITGIVQRPRAPTIAKVIHVPDRAPRCSLTASSTSSKKARTTNEYPRALVENNTSTPDDATTAMAYSAARGLYSARTTA